MICLFDRIIIINFIGPKSFTGENMCELQVHGSKAVIHAIMNALLKIPDFRPAEPGIIFNYSLTDNFDHSPSKFVVEFKIFVKSFYLSK